jgi:hypothetical protein
MRIVFLSSFDICEPAKLEKIYYIYFFIFPDFRKNELCGIRKACLASQGKAL